MGIAEVLILLVALPLAIWQLLIGAQWLVILQFLLTRRRMAPAVQERRLRFLLHGYPLYARFSGWAWRSVAVALMVVGLAPLFLSLGAGARALASLPQGVGFILLLCNLYGKGMARLRVSSGGVYRVALEKVAAAGGPIGTTAQTLLEQSIRA